MVAIRKFASATTRQRAFGRWGTLAVGSAAGAALLAWLARPTPLYDGLGAPMDLARSALGRNGPIARALDAYKWDLGAYPTTDDGLDALLRPKNQVHDRKYNGPYLDGIEVSDPWGTPYRYRFPGRVDQNRYDLWSCGPNKVDDDGHPGSDDISNWYRR